MPTQQVADEDERKIREEELGVVHRASIPVDRAFCTAKG
jgi:hypothetical protein